MAQFIPSVPGVGAALGTGLSKSLDTLTQAKVKQLIEAPQRQAYASALAAILGANPEQVQQDENVLQQQGIVQQPGQEARPQNTNQALLNALQKGGLNEQQLFQLAGLQQQKQLQVEAKQKESRKEQLLDQREINKRTQPFYDEVIAKGKSAQNNIKRAKRLEELSLKGSLPPAEVYKFLTKLEEVPSLAGGGIGATIGGVLGGLAGSVGGPAGALAGAAAGGATGAKWGGAIGGLIGPIASTLKTALARGFSDTEEFEKLSADFLKDAKGIFGGRITNADLLAFFQTVPTLNQTQHGRLKIIKNMKAFNEAAIAEYDALQEVVKENGGKRPDDLAFLVQKRAQEKIDKAAKEFEA